MRAQLQTNSPELQHSRPCATTSPAATRWVLPRLLAMAVSLFAASHLGAQDLVVFGDQLGDSAYNNETFANIYSGSRHTLARRANGTAVAWGDNRWGQCNVPALPLGVTYVELDGARQHSLALRSDGSVIAWGDNVYGQIDVPLLPPGVTFTKIRCGASFSLALGSDGLIRAWGHNPGGQTNPPAVPAGTTVVELAGGANHGLALLSDGTIMTWGGNSNGQTQVPALPNGMTYVQVTSGWDFSLALRSDGEVLAWGQNNSGQCDVPALPAGVTYVEVASGFGQHSLARRSDGVVVGWGVNDDGETTTPTLPVGVSFASLIVGDVHSGALRSDGKFEGWGSNLRGALNVPRAPDGVQYLDAYASASHTVAKRTDGVFVAWGENVDGRCTFPALPAGVSYTQFSLANHTMGLRSDGNIEAFGNNDFGQCNVPALPPGLTYVEVAAGSRHSVARRSDGSLAVWGGNTFGELNMPATPAGMSYLHVTSGGSFTLALRSDGVVIGWGDNPQGQTNCPSSPPGTSFVELDAGGNHSIGRLSNGEVLTWGGGNAYPVPALPVGVTFTSATAGWDHSLLFRSDGTLVAWGSNGYGQCNVPPLQAGQTYLRGSAGRGYRNSVIRGLPIPPCGPMASQPSGINGTSTVTWEPGTGGNGHRYEVVVAATPCGVTWSQAHDAATAAGGHLATIGSAQENAFVFALIDSAQYWNQSVGDNEGPWIGGMQPINSVEPSAGWRWATSESFDFSGWATSPDNGCGGSENRINFWSAAQRQPTWGDLADAGCGQRLPMAFVVEYEPSLMCVPSPNSFSLCAVSDATGNARLQLFNLPTGTLYGKTLVSMAPAIPMGSGSFFGLNADFLTLSILLAPNAPGDPLTWIVGENGVFPRTPYYFPPSVTAPFVGLTWDFVAIAVTDAGSIVFSNFVQKTW